MAKQYRMVHDQMLVRWLMATFPAGTWKMNVRLGKIRKDLLARTLSPEERRALSRWQAIADAIAIFEKVYIIECIVRPNEWYKIEKLEEYEQLFKVTEEYRPYWDWEIVKILLTTDISPYGESRAAARGIKVIRYTTPELEEYKSSLAKRKAQPPLGGIESP